MNDKNDSPEKPLVSIVTPVLNMADTLRDTIESILTQDYPNIEYIVMDGGSTDGTLDILRSYGDRFEWHTGPDRGQSDAINKGLALTSGQYLNWLCADDRLMPGTIKHLVSTLQNSPEAALAYGHVMLVYKNGTHAPGRHVRQGTLEELLNGDNFIPQSACLFTRQAWEAFGPLRTDLHYAMDWQLWIKMGQKHSFAYTPQTLSEVSALPETKSASGGLRRFEEIRKMLEAEGGRAAHTYYRTGLIYYRQGQMAEARQHLRIALSRGPSRTIRREIIGVIIKSYLGHRLMRIGRAARQKLGI